MPIKRLVGNNVFEPEEVTLLQEMLDQLCLIRGINRQSPEAESAAADLIAGYQKGMRGAELISALLP
jgi:hypothetical protein